MIIPLEDHPTLGKRDFSHIQKGTFSPTCKHVKQALHLSQGPCPLSSVLPSDSDEEDIDLFAESPEVEDVKETVHLSPPVGVRDASDWDDKEGTLRYQVGEVLHDRYQVIGYSGKGTFGSVLRAIDLQSDPKQTVAIKVARSHYEMNTAFEVEKTLLEQLGALDRKSHCTEMLGSFTFRKHKCLVLEEMKENARELLNRLGNQGVTLTACKVYGNQLLRALHHLHSLEAIHADLKPDNILIGENSVTAKLCDFGTALLKHQWNSVPAEYGSMYYRAPEIILGYEASKQADVWSLGCCLVEFFTGHILLQGESNNDMLHLMMQLTGEIPRKLLKNSRFASNHFEMDRFVFRQEYVDKATGFLATRSVVMPSKPALDLHRDILLPAAGTENKQILNDFKDVLHKMLVFDPKKRLTPQQLLKHPFFAQK